VPPDLSERVARAYRRPRGIPRMAAVIGHLSVAAAAVVIVMALLAGSAGLPRAEVAQPGFSVLATRVPERHAPGVVKPHGRYTQVRGHVVPVMLSSEVAYDLDSAVPMSQVSAQLMPQSVVDEVLSQGVVVSKGGDAGQGQSAGGNGQIPL
jgi:hypothetical protein